MEGTWRNRFLNSGCGRISFLRNDEGVAAQPQVDVESRVVVRDNRLLDLPADQTAEKFFSFHQMKSSRILFAFNQ